MPRHLIASEVRDFEEEQPVAVQPLWDTQGDMDRYLSLAREMVVLREEKSIIENREKELKKELMSILERLGVPWGDDNQHLAIDFPEPIRGVARFVRQARSSVKVDTIRAEAIARSHRIYNRLFPPVPTLDEGAVMVAREQGLLTDAEIDEIVPRTVTYAFVPEKAK